MKRILVGIQVPESRPWKSANLKAGSRFAARQAFRLAEQCGAEITLMTVLDDPTKGLFGSAENEGLKQELIAEAVELLDELGQSIAMDAAAPVTHRSEVRFGRPWLELIREVVATDQQLLISGTCERGRVSRMLFGSTGQKLLRNCPCPVWLTKPRTEDDPWTDVLATTDLSVVGEDVINAAVGLSNILDVRLHVLTAVDTDVDTRMKHVGMSEAESAQYREEMRGQAEQKLQQQLSATDYRTIPQGVRTVVAEGPADLCILDAIAEFDIDLLVMATSGRGGIPGMLLGNTAERVLNELPCSLLAIKPDDFVCPVDVSH